MRLPLQITFEGLEPTDAIRDHIERQIEKLGRRGRCVSHVRVGLGVPHRNLGRAAEFRVRIEMKVPHQKPLVVRARRSDDLYACIAEAVTSADRLLADAHARKLARRRRPSTRLCRPLVG